MIYFSAPFHPIYFTPGQQHTDVLEHVQIWISTFIKYTVGSITIVFHETQNFKKCLVSLVNVFILYIMEI